MSDVINANILTPTGFFKGESGNGYQYYQLTIKDRKGTDFVVSFGCKMAYIDSTEKAFRRLILIPAPQEELIAVESAKPNLPEEN